MGFVIIFFKGDLICLFQSVEYHRVLECENRDLFIWYIFGSFVQFDIEGEV